MSIVIPIYNAESLIFNNYKILRDRLKSIRQDYEILFEDDASRDKSKDILEKIAHYDNKVKVSSHYPNQGLGFTLRQLFKHARGEIIIYLDIDLPFGIDALPQLLEEIEHTDVVLASRYLTIKNRIIVAREIFSKLYYLLCKLLFNISVRDIGSGFIIFKRAVFDSINLTSRGFDIHMELFAKLKKQGFSIKEVPLKYSYNGYSTFSILKHGPRILIDTLKFWLKNR